MAGILSHISSTFESALEGSQSRMQSVYQNEYVSKGIKGILNSLRIFLQLYLAKIQDLQERVEYLKMRLDKEEIKMEKDR